MWFITKKASFEIIGYNFNENEELWVTKKDGKGYMVAKGKEAYELYIKISESLSRVELCLTEGRNGFEFNLE